MATVTNFTSSSTRSFDVTIDATEIMDALLVGLNAAGITDFPTDVTLDADDVMQIRDVIGNALLARGQLGTFTIHITETD